VRKIILAVTGAAALCVPVGALAAPPDHAPGAAKHDQAVAQNNQAAAKRQSAAQTCKAQRAELGKAAFRQLYGTNTNKANAFGRCVDQTKGTTAQEREDVMSAARTCRDEWNAGHEAFAQKYGTNENKRNSFGKCVSAAAKTRS
jgi:hypothetical protein